MGCVVKIGTAYASFNFVMAILARLSNKERTYALYHDIQKAFDTLNRDLMLLKPRDKGVDGCLWHLVRLTYTDMKSQVTLGGKSCAYFPILKCVAQGFPLSPILFNIYVDDLLNALHRAGQLHGITSADCQDKIRCQAYADDTNALSFSYKALQLLATIVP
jgi:hypothetical protein